MELRTSVSKLQLPRERKLDSSGCPTGLAIIISALFCGIPSWHPRRGKEKTDVRKIPDGGKHGQTDHMRTDRPSDRQRVSK